MCAGTHGVLMKREALLTPQMNFVFHPKVEATTEKYGDLERKED